MEFRGHYFFLSNFFLRSFVYKGIKYPSVEHAYQSLKAANPEDEKLIRSQRTPGEAKRLGRRVQQKKDFEDNKEQLMYELLEAKFRDPVLRNKLLEIQGPIVEDNDWHDTFWGKHDGVGLNKLGELLMELRERLRAS